MGFLMPHKYYKEEIQGRSIIGVLFMWTIWIIVYYTLKDSHMQQNGYVIDMIKYAEQIKKYNMMFKKDI